MLLDAEPSYGRCSEIYLGEGGEFEKLLGGNMLSVQKLLEQPLRSNVRKAFVKSARNSLYELTIMSYPPKSKKLKRFRFPAQRNEIRPFFSVTTRQVRKVHCGC